MTLKLAGMLIAATALLTACGEKGCTQAEATQKLNDLNARVQSLAATDPTKVATAAPKLQEIGTKVAASTDLDEVCAAMDEMMAELSK